MAVIKPNEKTGWQFKTMSFLFINENETHQSKPSYQNEMGRLEFAPTKRAITLSRFIPYKIARLEQERGF